MTCLPVGFRLRAPGTIPRSATVSHRSLLRRSSFVFGGILRFDLFSISDGGWRFAFFPGSGFLFGLRPFPGGILPSVAPSGRSSRRFFRLTRSRILYFLFICHIISCFVRTPHISAPYLRPHARHAPAESKLPAASIPNRALSFQGAILQA